MSKNECYICHKIVTGIVGEDYYEIGEEKYRHKKCKPELPRFNMGDKK